MNARKITVLALGMLLLTMAGIAPVVSAGALLARPDSNPIHHQYLPALVAARPTESRGRPPTIDPPAATNTPVPTIDPPTATNTPVPTAPPTATTVPTAPAGPVFYVATTGSDSNAGTLASPWRTIGKAAATLVAGDTVYIRGGVYKEVVNFARSGTASQPISVLAYAGEVPVVDGNNFTIPASTWGVLFRLSGDYIHVAGLEVRYSNWIGVGLYGRHDSVSHLNAHDNMENGIIANADYTTVEFCRVWRNAYSYSPEVRRGTNWAAGLTARLDLSDGVTSYAILRGNEVYNNWGEGLSTGQSDHALLEDNIVYDNLQANLYIHDTTDTVVQRNLVYVTPNNLMGTSGSQTGIMMGDEHYNPASANITIINNLVYGGHCNFYWWQGSSGGGLNNVLVADNTFVNARSDSDANFKIASGTHANTRIYNNIVEQDDSTPIALLGSSSGLSFSNNLWSKAPSPSVAATNAIIGNPQLAKSEVVASGALTGNYFKLLTGSPAHHSALPLGSVSDDYFGHPRGRTPDVGGAESAG